VRIQPKSFRLLLPTPADVLVGHQPPKRLETLGEIICGEKLREMLLELLVRLVVIALDGRLLDSAIHSLDLPVRPRVIDFGQPMLDAMLFTDAVEQVLESPFILQAIGKLDAVVREDDMNAVRHGGAQTAEELAGRGARLVRMQLGVSEFRCAVDGDEEIEPPLLSLNLCNVHMEVADGVLSKLLLCQLVTSDFGQTADAVTLQAAMEAGTSQVRDAGLQGVEAIVEREQRPLTEGDDHDLFLHGEHGRARLARPHLGIFNSDSLAPLSHGLGVEVVALGQTGYALLTTLYRSTQCRSRAGAAV
jgi:hypothetical protein